MAAYIEANGQSYMFHMGDSAQWMNDQQENGPGVTDVRWVQADGHELQHVTNRYPHLPRMVKARSFDAETGENSYIYYPVQRWYGVDAQYAADALAME